MSTVPRADDEVQYGSDSIIYGSARDTVTERVEQDNEEAIKGRPIGCVVKMQDTVEVIHGNRPERGEQGRIDTDARFVEADLSDGEDSADWLRIMQYGYSQQPWKARRHGEIEDMPVGTRFKTRLECYREGMHNRHVHGIAGSVETGAWSVVLSGGYEDNKDMGDTIIYTGSGGQTSNDWHGGPQTSDQSPTNRGNRILLKSLETGNPVRVIRGYRAFTPYSPPRGYRYDGLYRVTKARERMGSKGYMIYRFTLRRIVGQIPISYF